MIWTVLGTAAFGLLILFEVRKCGSAVTGRSGRNPWFLAGLVLLVLSFAGMGLTCPAAKGLRPVFGILLLILGTGSYAYVLTAGPKKKSYLHDAPSDSVSRGGLYGRMRHPGVWSFLLCSLGFGAVFPDRMAEALWLALLNLIYTWLQDRYFFPVYLKGYEEYRKEVPYLIPGKRGYRN